MKFKRVEIENILGISDRLILEPDGDIIVIAGQNASGKSSFLKALRNIVEGGSLYTIRNVNAPEDKQSEILLLIEYAGVDYEIRKYTTPKGENLTVKRRVGDTIAFEAVEKPPQTFINCMFDKKSLNPLEFWNADDKKRVQLLLEAMVLDFNRDDLWKTIGLEYKKFPAVNEEQHPLKEIAEVRKNIFEKRTGINTTRTSKEKTAEELRRTIPATMPPAPEDIALKQAELNGEIARLEGFKKDAETKYKESYRAIDEKRNKERSERAAALKQIKADLDAELARHAAELNEKLESARSKMDEELSALEEHYIEIGMKIDAEKESTEPKVESMQSKVTELTAEIASMQTAAEERAAIDERRKLVDKYTAEAESLRGESDHLTSALEALDKYKANMTKDLPIKGLDITDNVIRVNSVPWSQLNTQRQYDVAIQVAIHRQKHMELQPLVIVDGAEQLDPDNFEILENALRSAGVAAFMARVTGLPFSIFSGPGAIEQIKEKENSK